MSEGATSKIQITGLTQLHNTLEKLLKIIPSEENLHKALKSNLSSVTYSPPESFGLWYSKVVMNLEGFLGNTGHTSGWEKQVEDTWFSPELLWNQPITEIHI